ARGHRAPVAAVGDAPQATELVISVPDPLHRQALVPRGVPYSEAVVAAHGGDTTPIRAPRRVRDEIGVPLQHCKLAPGGGVPHAARLPPSMPRPSGLRAPCCTSPATAPIV